MYEAQRIKDALRDAFSSKTSDSFTNAATVLSRFKADVREELQRVTSDDMNRILEKIEKQKPLDTHEIDTLRLWIIGDAEGYVAMENNFKDWLNEFERLKGSIEKHLHDDNSPDQLIRLHGLLEDAIRVAADLSNFLEKKERVEKFEKAAYDQNPDFSFLADLLSTKLRSEDL